MWFAVALLCVCQFASMIGLGLFLRHYVEKKQTELELRLADLVATWTTPPEPGKPHKLAELVETVGEVVGRSAAQSIMASFNAGKSHEARVANGLADEIQGQQMPLWGLLSGSRRGRGAAIGRLMELIGPVLSGAPAGQPGGDGNSSVRSRLQRQS